MTARPFIIVAALALGLAQPACAASFRPNVVVDGDTVTLGDVFEDAGAAAQQPVAEAPAPGRRMILDARVLAGLAQAYGLDWRPASPRDRTVVERSAVILGADRVQSLVEDALARQGVPRPFGAVFDHRAGRLALPTGAGEVKLQSITYDPGMQRFSGTIEAQTPNGPVALPVAGRVVQVVEVPVLNRAIDPGGIISIADLDLVRMQADRVARDTLMKAEDIVGRTADRILEPRRPLRSHDLKRDLVIKRGDTVVMTLDDPNMSLTASGRALTDAAKGEPVKVLNLSSSRMVDGIAAGPDLVSVPGAGIPNNGTIASAGADPVVVQ